MSFQFNRGEIAQALAQFLGFKGTLSLDGEATLLPTVTIASLVDTPYLQYAIPVGTAGSVGATAAENSMVLARPGLSVALAIQKIIVTNDGAAVQDVQFRRYTAADIATAGLTSVGQFTNFGAIDSELVARPSDVLAGSHTAIAGRGLGLFHVQPDDQLVLDFPAPGIVLYGNDAQGRPAFGAVVNTQNEALRCAFFGKEWPLPG